MTIYHFIGIKGSGMSALAQVLHDMGYHVQGSDVETVYFTQKPLEEKGIPIFSFSDQHITEDMTVIYSPAFPDDNVEIKRSRELGLPIYKYVQFLGEFAKRFKSIAISGSHGKTSTTGIMAHVLENFESTSYLIGDGTGKGVKESHYFVFEACEYRRHFLNYHPYYAVITNIDFDHPDYFQGVDDVSDAFQTFAQQINKGLVACGDDRRIRQLKVSVPVLLYGFEEGNDLQAKNITAHEHGLDFDVYYQGQWLDLCSISQHGKHNVLNALSVMGVCLLEDYPMDKVKQYMQSFKGVKRRFTEKTWLDNVLIDDYAHHPTEISATIEAVRTKYPHKKLVSIFQPHTYSRTKVFLDQFSESLAASDDVYLCDIFGSAREDKGELSVRDLMIKLPHAKFMSEQSVDQLSDYTDAVLLFMGAGDIQKVQHAFEIHVGI